MERNRRRRYFINKDYQTRFIVRFAVITTAWSLAAASLFAFVVGKRLEAAMYTSHLRITSASEIILPAALYAEGIALVFYCLLLGYAILDLYKKTATPLYMLKKDILRFGNGDLMSPIQLRPQDAFQDLSSALDDMRKNVGLRFSGVKASQDALAEAVARLERSALQGEAAADHLAMVRESAARLKEAVHAFTI